MEKLIFEDCICASHGTAPLPLYVYVKRTWLTARSLASVLTPLPIYLELLLLLRALRLAAMRCFVVLASLFFHTRVHGNDACLKTSFFRNIG
jgi:hypothetical protein